MTGTPEPVEPTDASLLRRYQTGDEAAATDLYLRHAPRRSPAAAAPRGTRPVRRRRRPAIRISRIFSWAHDTGLARFPLMESCGGC